MKKLMTIGVIVLALGGAALFYRQYGMAQDISAPQTGVIILDLTGSGFHVNSANGRGVVYFDIDQDQFAEATSWPKPGNGFLVNDRNNDGKINDQSEMFGGFNNNGFEALKSLDSNNDSLINDSDTDFAKLLIWQDFSQDGVARPNELSTLSEAGIISIGLKEKPTNQLLDGSQITALANVVMNGNKKTQVAAIRLSHEQMNSVWTGSINLTSVMFFPDLKGYGDLPNLQVSAAQNEALRQKLQEISSTPSLELFGSEFDLRQKITDILLLWAKADQDTPEARASYFIGKFVGQPLDQVPKIVGLDPQTRKLMIERAFDDLVYSLGARILLQTMAREFYNQSAIYEPNKDVFEGDWRIDIKALSKAALIPQQTAEMKRDKWLFIFALLEHSQSLKGIGAEQRGMLDELVQLDNQDGALTYQKILDEQDRLHKNLGPILFEVRQISKAYTQQQ